MQKNRCFRAKWQSLRFSLSLLSSVWLHLSRLASLMTLPLPTRPYHSKTATRSSTCCNTAKSTVAPLSVSSLASWRTTVSLPLVGRVAMWKWMANLVQAGGLPGNLSTTANVSMSNTSGSPRWITLRWNATATPNRCLLTSNAPCTYDLLYCFAYFLFHL